MSRYYAHKVGYQEMGSIAFPGDRPHRGRYFLISKQCLSFFPQLSSVVLNDKCILTVVPMFKDREQQKVLCTMDYHNQKFADITYSKANPRDEVRFYMNNAIDPDLYYRQDDYVVFEKIIKEEETIYSLTRITPEEKGYETITHYMEQSSHNTNVLIDEELDFIEQPTIGTDAIVTITEDAEKLLEEESKVVIDHIDEEESEFEEKYGSALFNSVSFRDFVMNAYQYKCAITHRSIRYKDLLNLEAAHIKPQAHNGKFLPCYGIAMSRDMHFAFDKGFFTIGDDYKVIVSEKLQGNWFYEEYNGTEIFVPEVDFFKPEKRFLHYHQEHIFDTFQQIRRL